MFDRSVSDVAKTLATNPANGLSADDAVARARESGPNALPEARSRGPLKRFLIQFNSPLIYVLIASAVVTFLLTDYVDSWVIAGVVLINAIIGFIQEGRAEKALDAVRSLLADRAVVVRGGVVTEVPASTLVVGDVILVESGSKVPADARIAEASSLSVSEASLTGESVPVTKTVDAVDSSTVLAERTSMLYAGTLITSGNARALVTAIGHNTELGKIGSLVSQVAATETPLAKRLDRFALQVTIAIVAIGAAVFAVGVFIRDEPIADVFLSVVALAVAAIPEGLPAVVTIVLALGTRAMARSGALVRRLPAVESLGSVSIIWTDKTGTLTENKMTVASVVTGDRELTVTGVGYDTDGSFLDHSTAIPPLDDPTTMALLTAGMLCNRAEINGDHDGNFHVVGDPMEAALLILGTKAGLNRENLVAENPQVGIIPFESETRFMATRHAPHDTPTHTLWVKGAPEKVIQLCAEEWDGSPLDRETWSQKVEALARGGQRVLALAGAELVAGDPMDDKQLPDGLRFIGLVGVIDPPRPQAREAIAACQAAGIDVKMITGDHVVTAAAIGTELGINAKNPLTGEEIDYLSDLELGERLANTDVVARANPEHKLRLVALSQQAGFQVAMTGDGVNDAPALQAADIGVAMGKNGTDAARQASDLVLTDDRFETIEKAVERGRVVFDNIKKTVMFVLPTDIGEASVVMVALLAGWVLPITASQILWVNLVTAVTLSLALVVERGERGVMDRPPRPAAEPLITRRLLARIVLVGLLMLAVTLGGYWWQVSSGASLEESRTTAVTMLVVAEMWYLFNTRRFTQSGFTRETFTGNRAALATVGILIGLQLAFTYLPAFNAVFGTAPIGAGVWGVAVGAGFIVFVIVELEKWLWRKRRVKSF